MFYLWSFSLEIVKHGSFCNVELFYSVLQMPPFSQHDTWRKRLEVDVAAKEAELQALKDARDVDRRLLGINHQ